MAKYGSIARFLARSVLLIANLDAVLLVSFGQVPPTPQSGASNSDKAPRKCRVEGQVVSLSSGEPLRRATLRLRNTASSSVGSVNHDAVDYVSTSDNSGKFFFEDVEPGSYVLSGERAGYIREDYGARSPSMRGAILRLDGGRELKELVLRLMAQGTISGRVVDADGEPITNAIVHVLHWTYWSGGRKQLSGVGTTSELPDGTFVSTNLPPGAYYLSASVRTISAGPSVKSGHKGPEESFVTTYYPTASEPSMALPIDVAVGANIRGIELHMQKSAVFHVRGKVTDTTTAAPIQNMTLRLMANDSISYFSETMNRRVVAVRSGSFEFREVPRGVYVIEPNNTGPPVGRCVVRVIEDVDDFVCSFGPGAEIVATVKTEDLGLPQSQQNAAGSQSQVSVNPVAAPHRSPTQLALSLLSAEGFPASANAAKEDDATFRIHAIPPRRFRINIAGVPDGTYVKSIRYQERDITHEVLDLTSGQGGALQILLSAGAADVKGFVRNSRGEAISGAMVTLWSPGQSIPGGFDPVRAVYTDQDGGFHIANLGPGDYRIAAWDDIDTGLVQNLDFLGGFEGEATTLKLAEGASETVEINPVDRNAIDTQLAKMR